MLAQVLHQVYGGGILAVIMHHNCQAKHTHFLVSSHPLSLLPFAWAFARVNAQAKARTFLKVFDHTRPSDI